MSVCSKFAKSSEENYSTHCRCSEMLQNCCSEKISLCSEVCAKSVLTLHILYDRRNIITMKNTANLSVANKKLDSITTG